MDHKLTWSYHVDKVCCKLASSAFLIRSLRDTVTPEVLRFAYFGLVQSIVSYGLMFWGPAADFRRAFVAQKKVIRIMCRLSPMSHCRPAFVSLRFLTLPCLYIYIYQLVVFVKRWEHTFSTNSDFHEHSTRGGHGIRLPFSRLAVSQNSIRYQGAKLFNKMSSLLGINSDLHLSSYKAAVFNYLVTRAFYSVDEFLNDHQ